MTCTNCGKEVTNTGTFCPYCGSSTAGSLAGQNPQEQVRLSNPNLGMNQQQWKAANNPDAETPQRSHHRPLGGGYFFNGLLYPFKAYGVLGLIKAYLQLLIPIINYRVMGFALSTLEHVGNGYGETLAWKKADKKIMRGLTVFLISLLYSLPVAAWILFIERKAYIGSITSNGMFRFLVFIGYLVFGILMYHFPMGLAHFAVTGKLRSALNFRYINRLIQNRKLPYLLTVVLSVGLYFGILALGYIFQSLYFVVVPILILFYTATWSYWFGHHYFYARSALPTEMGGRGMAINAVSVLPLLLSGMLLVSSVLTPVSYAVDMSELTGEPRVELGIEEKNRQEKMDVLIKKVRGEATDADVNEVFNDQARRISENSSMSGKDIDKFVFWSDKASNYIPGVNTLVGSGKTIYQLKKAFFDSKDSKDFSDNFSSALWEGTKTFGNSIVPGSGGFLSGLGAVEDIASIADRYGNQEKLPVIEDQNEKWALNPYQNKIFMQHYSQSTTSSSYGVDNGNVYNSQVMADTIKSDQEAPLNYQEPEKNYKEETNKSESTSFKEPIAEEPQKAIRLEPMGDEYMVFDNFNIEGVVNHGKPPRFTLKTHHKISKIMTYHWNDANGSEIGEIGLMGSDNTPYGPWEAYGIEGQGGVPNAYMVVEPNVELPPGEYRIYTSQLDTWSTNTSANGLGMAQITGVELKEVEVDQNAPPTTPVKEAVFKIHIKNDSLSSQVLYMGHNSTGAKQVASGGTATFEVILRYRKSEDGRDYFEDKILLNANNGTSVISNKLPLKGYQKLYFKFTDLDFQMTSPF